MKEAVVMDRGGWAHYPVPPNPIFCFHVNPLPASVCHTLSIQGTDPGSLAPPPPVFPGGGGGLGDSPGMPGSTPAELDPLVWQAMEEHGGFNTLISVTMTISVSVS